MACPGSAMTGSGLPDPNGPARSIVACRSILAAVDQKRVLAPCGFDHRGKRLLEIGAKRPKRAALERDARRHGVTAPFGEQALSDRVAHHAAEVDARDRAARARAAVAGLARDRKGRPAATLPAPR